MSATLSPEARSFVDKWLLQEPEMEPALGFEPADTRALAACWGALQNEVFDTAVLLRDSGVSQVKLAWWGEALSRGAGQSAAHPLVRGLFADAAAANLPAALWQGWLRAALDLGMQDATPADPDAALALRLPYAQAVVDIESRLFSPVADVGAGKLPRAVAVGLLLRQLRGALRGEPGRIAVVPLQFFARHGVRPGQFDATQTDAATRSLLGDVAQALAAALPASTPAVRQRRCRIALDRRLLQALQTHPTAATTTLPRLGALWTAWRAARASAA